VNTPEFQAFLDKQAGIYGNFAKGMALAIQEGTTPDPVITGNKGGFLLFLEPSNSIVEIVAELGLRARNIVPGILTYSYENTHTTISDYRVADGLRPDADEQHKVVLEALRRTAWAVGKKIALLGGVSCTYRNGFVFNKTTLILQGILSNDHFPNIAETALAVAEENQITLRIPWGAHVTGGRFSLSNSPEEAVALAELCRVTNQRLPAGEQFFKGVGVGWFTTDKNGFNLHKETVYPL
jgi:hypothetical protein